MSWLKSVAFWSRHSHGARLVFKRTDALNQPEWKPQLGFDADTARNFAQVLLRRANLGGSSCDRYHGRVDPGVSEGRCVGCNTLV